MNLTDDELIIEVLDRAMKSELFCIRMINTCKDFIRQLDEENN